MRVLLIPELYRPDDATANGTLNDLVALAEQWLRLDETLHLYWLLSPRETANYDGSYVLADRERVTLVEAPSFMAGSEHEDAFSETGHTEAELQALRERIYDQLGYVDVVVDQRVTGRFDLYKWLLELGDHENADVQPVHLIGNVHDLRLPFKRHGRQYPNGAPMKVELLASTFVDGLWFKASVDERRMREYGTEILQETELDAMLDSAVETGSPIDFEAFDEEYAEEPRWLHVAGSGWGKKNIDDVLDVAQTLYERYDIQTVMTNMDPIHPPFAEREFVDAYPEASPGTYERALELGDLTVCASDHETLARTPFEQAATGQVLVARDRPWIHDCVPDDYRLLGAKDDLESIAIWVVEHWEAAIAANRRLVKHVTAVRDPERCGRRTHADLTGRVEARVKAYTTGAESEAVQAVLDIFDDEPIALSDLNRRTGEHTSDGRVLDSDSYTLTDLVYTLRTLGYEDIGNPGTPKFRCAETR